jgi:hypothetical protein
MSNLVAAIIKTAGQKGEFFALGGGDGLFFGIAANHP